MKILAIDDHRDNLIALQAVLRDALPGSTVLTAPDGATGIAKTRSEDPDVILLDIVMPGMDGFAVCRQLKADAWLRDIPVLFLTALRADRESRSRALDAGADGFLSKPFDEVELTAQVRAMAKIRAASRRQRLEKEQLMELVAERTRDLERELTEHRRTEQELREKRDMIVKLTALVPGVVYQYRLDPDGHSAFPFASPGMNNIYEVTPDEVREDAMPVFGRLHPDDHDHIVAAIQESARTLQPFHCEFRVVLPRQGLRWRLSDAMPERLANGGTLWHGIISDITDRKRSEEEMHTHMAELQRWYEVTLGREGRVLELKAEVNALLAQAGLPRRYTEE